MARTLDCGSATLSKLRDLEKLSLQNVREENIDNMAGESGGDLSGAGVRQLWEELPESQEGETVGVSRGRGRGRSGGRGGAGDVRVRLERSRQSARECRARKKLRYQYLDDMIAGQQADHVIETDMSRYVCV